MMKTANRKKAALEDWHPADIVAALRKAGWSLSRLSVHHGYHRSALAHGLRGPYPQAERLIAEAIGISPEEIWPQRYAERAQRQASQHTTRRRGRQSTKRRSQGHSTAGAA